MAVDRTRELLELCAAMPRADAAAQHEPPRPAPAYVAQMGEACASIAERAFDAREKLEHLGALVRKSSIFSDPAEQMALLITAVNDELGAGAQELQAARRLLDAPRKAGAASECFKHCAAMESQCRVELETVSKEFKALLQKRTDGLRERTERRELFGAKKEEQPRRARVPKFDDGALPRPHAGAAPPPGGLPADTYASGSQQQQQLQQQAPLIPDEVYLHTRASATADIEAQVAQIGSIFGKLSTLIAEQSESVERIEANVEASSVDFQRGRDALTHTLHNMSSNAATAMKVGGIILSTLVVYTIFIV
ncbi:t-SNARE [Pelagophyceae sp. CCMP2097]|nr:t-SNARE [Pelagophyceae sp. CCMP2097]